MKIRFSPTTAYARAEPAVARFQQLIQQLEAARDHAFHSVWVGDHHVTPDVYYQSVPTSARLSAHAGSMHIGPFLLLPLYHPARVTIEGQAKPWLTREVFCRRAVE